MKWVDLEQLRERQPVVAAITPAVEESNIKRSTLLAKSNGLPRSLLTTCQMSGIAA